MLRTNSSSTPESIPKESSYTGVPGTVVLSQLTAAEVQEQLRFNSRCSAIPFSSALRLSSSYNGRDFAA